MNDWKIRIIYPPESLFRKISPFPPTYGYRMIGTRRRLILRDYPYTLYDRGEDRTIRWLGFVYAFLYWNKEGKQVLRLERPSSFVEKEDMRERVYNRLLDECTRLAEILRADLLELELYRRIGGEICFPSTLSYFNSYNSPEIIEFFVKAGFRRRNTEFVFALPSHPLPEKNSQNETHGYAIKRYGNSTMERKRYWSLWSKSPYCVEKSFPQQETDWELDYGMRIARDPRFVLFAWKNKEIVGFTHWFPNFYRIDVKMWSAKSSTWIIGQSKGIESGKIFKVMVNPDFDSKDVRIALCVQAMKTMQEEFGLTKIHIGNIHANDRTMLGVIEELRGKKLHTIDLLEKRT